MPDKRRGPGSTGACRRQRTRCSKRGHSSANLAVYLKVVSNALSAASVPKRGSVSTSAGCCTVRNAVGDCSITPVKSRITVELANAKLHHLFQTQIQYSGGLSLRCPAETWSRQPHRVRPINIGILKFPRPRGDSASYRRRHGMRAFLPAAATAGNSERVTAQAPRIQQNARCMADAKENAAMSQST